MTGAPFYVMEFVDGLVPRDEAAVTSTLDEPAREAVAFNLADTLADLHAVDVDAVGLGELAKRTDYIARQLHRWSGQYEKGSERDLPLVMQVHDRLQGRHPRAGPAGDRPRGLPTGQHDRGSRTARSGRCWTGSCARWGTRWPTWGCCRCTGRRPRGGRCR